MVGAPASVVRALIMVFCGFAAAYLGRTYDLLSALGFSAVLILWDSPYRLCQSGVQLSFGAVAGIGGLAPWLIEGLMKTENKYAVKSESEYIQGVRKGYVLRNVLTVSLSMQFLTLPVVLYHFFQVPPYSFVLNFLVVPLMGIVVASGVAGIFLGSFCLPLGRFAIGSGQVILSVYEYLCRLWSLLPGSNQILGRPGMRQIAVFYGVLAVAAVLCRRGAAVVSFYY